MYKKVYLLLFFCLLVVASNYGQCKYGSNYDIKRVNKKFSINIRAMHTGKFLFDNPTRFGYRQLAVNFFIEENGDYVFFIFLEKIMTNPFKIMKDQKIVINLQSDLKVTLQSMGNFESSTFSTSIPPHYSISVIYKINKEQIEILARSPLLGMQIYFSSEKSIDDTFEDENGKFFTLEMKRDNQQTELSESANCILQIDSN